MNRVGLGVDAHRFDDDKDRPLVLGGVRIPGSRGLAGHSDGDVVAHAIADALLGAAGLGDIGARYPATPQWKDAHSIDLLADCCEASRVAGWRVVNVDAVVVCEEPKLAPHRQGMIDNIARALDVTSDSVSVKATTTDGMGSIGRGEGIAAMAVVQIEAR